MSNLAQWEAAIKIANQLDLEKIQAASPTDVKFWLLTILDGVKAADKIAGKKIEMLITLAKNAGKVAIGYEFETQIEFPAKVRVSIEEVAKIVSEWQGYDAREQELEDLIHEKVLLALQVIGIPGDSVSTEITSLFLKEQLLEEGLVEED